MIFMIFNLVSKQDPGRAMQTQAFNQKMKWRGYHRGHSSQLLRALERLQLHRQLACEVFNQREATIVCPKCGAVSAPHTSLQALISLDEILFHQFGFEEHNKKIFFLDCKLNKCQSFKTHPGRSQVRAFKSLWKLLIFHQRTARPSR